MRPDGAGEFRKLDVSEEKPPGGQDNDLKYAKGRPVALNSGYRRPSPESPREAGAEIRAIKKALRFRGPEVLSRR